MSGTDGVEDPTSNSLSGLLSTLIPLLAVNSCLVGLFFLLRDRVKPVYQSRALAFPDEVRDADSRLAWLKLFWASPDAQVTEKQSLDAYLLLRFFRVLLKLALSGCLIVWPVILPLNATGAGKATQLDALAITNIADPMRFYAHAGAAAIYYVYVMYVVSREADTYLELRQLYLLSPEIERRLTSRIVLFTDAPSQELEEESLRKIFYGVRRIWIPKACPKLARLIDKRDGTIALLEQAITAGSLTAWALWNKHTHHDVSLGVQRRVLHFAIGQVRLSRRCNVLARRRPVGLDFVRSHAKRLGQLSDDIQRSRSLLKPLRSVFVEFDSTQAAVAAAQLVWYHRPASFRAHTVGLNPAEIIWSSLALPSWRRDGQVLAANLGVCLMILLWSPLTAFVGVLSSANYLSSLTPFAWVDRVPAQIVGLITGLVPSVALTLLLSLVPILLRVLARRCGSVSLAEAERRVQKWYFAFQVIQTFLCVTVGSSAAAVLRLIQLHPSEVSRVLARGLPKASNFYINYFVQYGVAVSASTLINYSALFLRLFVATARDDTPRKVYARAMAIPVVDWGTIYPQLSMLGVIFLTYAILSPLILGFAAVAISLLYVAFRYNVFYALDCNFQSTHGSYFVTALRHVMTGVYLGQLCLAGVFVIRALDDVLSFGPVMMMAVLLVGTTLAQARIWTKLRPLTRHLPQNRLHEIWQASDQRTGSLSRWPWPESLNSEFRQHVEAKEPASSQESSEEAYLHPSQRTVPSRPTLWIVKGPDGYAEVIRDLLGQDIPVQDVGTWWQSKRPHLDMTIPAPNT